MINTTKITSGAASLLIAGAVATVFGGAASAKDLRYAIGWPAGALPVEAVQTYADTVEEASDGDITVKVFPLSLLNFLESSSGVRDGIADMTTVLTPYFLSEFPNTNFASELASLSELVEGDRDRMVFAYTGAIMEYVLFNCDACVAEFEAQNQIYTAGAATPPYMLQCTKPVTSAEDLKGTRVRAGGAFWSRWVEAMGATPVSISVNETFEALNQGVIDCTASSASELTNFSFIDVVTDITTDIPGSSFSSGVTNVNLDTWRGLDDAGRTALLRGSAAVAAHLNWAYWTEAKDNVAKAEERGINFRTAEPEMLKASRDWIESDVTAMVDAYAERGVENGAENAQKMRDILMKWVPMVEGVETVEAMTELYWTEVLSKVDVATYGK
ncbi:C4-dicarboxylate TRAP transporter substrate-binding protein [Sulfitobacter sp. F26169L]|uniref:C4-dicarboxylate TRAP transporter substrate-binding protein n=1 Tax=Sulfitobacter sp. F26169L TaxID=2996015 RepID=UPI002260CBBB|nr:C4-dicarboxylate TRAP transporter substrate-binding protein [Sulfitobacter sp. F26169L]MCX7567920.1 C4-dicarboxylate TRAP transporter substrate-binding protein [Sulfitobacter sp. F26169L]